MLYIALLPSVTVREGAVSDFLPAFSSSMIIAAKGMMFGGGLTIHEIRQV